MSRSVFVDTSAIVAYAVEREASHAGAIAELRRLEAEGVRLVTSTDVFDETVTHLRARAGHALAVAVGERLRRSQEMTLIPVTERLRTAAWGIFVRYADQDLSFTDCTSTALARAENIREVFTFDHGFARVGFTLLPRAT